MTTVDMRDQHQADYTQVCILKAHVRLISMGMSHSRLNKGDIMRRARELTGGEFGLRDYASAILALERRRDTLLTYIQNGG